MTFHERGEGTGRRSLIAAIVFLAFTTPLGIAAHLISELAGLGWHDDADVLFSARHGYLAAAALCSLATLFVAMLSVRRDERRTRIAELVDALPFRGSGAGFTLASFVAQFGFFALTQIGEGCPLCSGDVFVGVVAAAVAAAIGALAVSLGKRRIVAFALALIHALAVIVLRVADVRCAREIGGAVAPLPRRRTPFSFRYRPPPVIGNS